MAEKLISLDAAVKTLEKEISEFPIEQVKWRRPESKVSGRKRQEGDRNAKTLGKQLRV